MDHGVFPMRLVSFLPGSGYPEFAAWRRLFVNKTAADRDLQSGLVVKKKREHAEAFRPIKA
jgi:hypothetical protein